MYGDVDNHPCLKIEKKTLIRVIQLILLANCTFFSNFQSNVGEKMEQSSDFEKRII